MGRMTADAMADAANNGEITLDAALAFHLRYNHYPPIPESMVPVAKEAIQKANDGAWDDEIELPEGVSFRGRNTAPVHEVVTAQHLESFLEG